MGQDSTLFGGSQERFHTTIWSDVLKAGDRNHPESREKLSQLCQAYWRPVYAYVRRSWGKSVDDAKDLTQGFFARFLEKDYLSRLQPERGSFRGYLKQALHHFLINEKQSDWNRRAQGRLIRLDATPEEFERLGLASPEETADRMYDREWFRCVVGAAIGELRERLEREGKASYFQAFETYCLQSPEGLLGDAAPEAPTYHEVAEKLGIKEDDVRNYLSSCRRTLREIVKTHLREYTASEDDVDRELREAAGG